MPLLALNVPCTSTSSRRLARSHTLHANIHWGVHLYLSAHTTWNQSSSQLSLWGPSGYFDAACEAGAQQMLKDSVCEISLSLFICSTKYYYSESLTRSMPF